MRILSHNDHARYFSCIASGTVSMPSETHVCRHTAIVWIGAPVLWALGGIIFCPGTFYGQEPLTRGVGLEAETAHTVWIMQPRVRDDTARLLLSEARLRSRAELHLRQSGLTVAEPRTESERLNSPSLLIKVHIVGGSFHVAVDFVRNVTYSVEGTSYLIPAITWGYDSSGTHGGDANFVINSLERLLDEFVREYRAANRPGREE
jgi:hypothetical protein